MKGAVIGFGLGLLLAVLGCYFVGFFETGQLKTFWEGSHLGIDLGVGVVLGMVLLNFIISNSDKFFNKKL